MNGELIHLVESFTNRHVLLVGDFMLDRYVFGDAERISPEAPVPVLRVVERQDRVGGAGSVALNVLALGAHVHCVGLLGKDPFGDRVERFLADAGADTHGLLRVEDRPTITKTRLVGLAEHRHRQQILRVDDEVVRPPSEADSARLVEAVQSALPDADVVCLEDYGKGLLSPEVCQRLIAAARKHAKPVLIDPARIGNWEKYRGATVITPNRAELELGVGGAGDAVLAMVAVAVAAGATFEQAVPLANIAGGLEVSKFGCVPIARDEVINELRHGHDGARGKIRGVTELVGELNARRQRGETVVFTNGCFDLLHPGHVELLEQAKARGSLLVVGLNSDASARAQTKGTGRPVRNEQDRARLLAALEAVDYVVLFDEPDPARLIEQVAPDVLVKGSDWADKGVVGREFVESRGGRVELIELVEGYSTTGELERIRTATTRE